MKKVFNKVNRNLSMLSLVGVLAVQTICSVPVMGDEISAAEKEQEDNGAEVGTVRDLVGEVDPAESVVGKWCVTGGHADETIEFLEDETMILASGGVKTKGNYMQDPTNGCVYYMLDGASETQVDSGILYYKINGDHLALLSTEEEMELAIYTAYYTREESVEAYDTEDEIDGLQRKAWTVKSGVETIDIAGEEYNADSMYYVFGMNLLQIGQPKNMGDGYYTKMIYAPYEYSEDCTKITFFFNEPFSEEIGVTYEMEFAGGEELKFVSDDGEEIVFELVEITE